jgi:hypothetical protein
VLRLNKGKNSLEISFKKNHSFYSKDFLKALVIAFAFHSLLFLFFKIENHTRDEPPILPFFAVEIDPASLEMKPSVPPIDRGIRLIPSAELDFPQFETLPKAPYADGSECWQSVFDMPSEFIYTSSLQSLDVREMYVPFRVNYTFEDDDIVLTDECVEKLSIMLPKIQETKVVGFAFEVILDVGCGKISAYETKQQWQDHPEAATYAEETIAQLEFCKGKEGHAEGKLELWMELEAL